MKYPSLLYRAMSEHSAFGLISALAVACLVNASACQAAPLEETVKGFVLSQIDGRWGSPSIQVGTPDPRLTLAACERHEPYILAGSVMWGRTAVGVRCTQGANWSITLPVSITIHGMAWVAQQALPAGAKIDPTQVKQNQVELTREPGTPVTDLGQINGRTLTRRLNPGDVLRVEQFKATVTIQAGDPVRIQLQGNAFQIQSDGVALHPGAEGQTLRVRTDAGRVLSGTLRGRTVEVLL